MKEIKVAYYENGNVKSKTPFVNGKKHGMGKKYWANGKLRYKYPYKNGKLRFEASYKNGKAHGIRKIYDEKGELILKVLCMYGVLVKRINFERS
ncbi:MAG: hypothetical protein IJ950_01645 [Helicobacter sp.]|nr:hypothetical protein [Helicobacter sp.]